VRRSAWSGSSEPTLKNVIHFAISGRVDSLRDRKRHSETIAVDLLAEGTEVFQLVKFVISDFGEPDN